MRLKDQVRVATADGHFLVHASKKGAVRVDIAALKRFDPLTMKNVCGRSEKRFRTGASGRGRSRAGRAAVLLGFFCAFSWAATSLTGCATSRPSVRVADKAQALPLALDDGFQFRKIKSFLNEPELLKRSEDRMLDFATKHVNYGAVSGYDRAQREGHYFTFFWKAKRQSDITFRFEYRQERLGSHVQAREIDYPGVKGAVKTEVSIIGDDYREDGRITGWRALLIEDGKIVGLTQSFLWN